MAASKRQTRKTGAGKPRARKPKSRKAAPATVGARLDATLAGVGVRWRRLLEAVLARRLAFGTLAVLCLVILRSCRRANPLVRRGEIRYPRALLR